MIEITHTPTVDEFLSHPDNLGFWEEIGCQIRMPEQFRYFYEDGCLMVVEPMCGIAGIHIACLPESRGKKCLAFGIECISYLLSQYDKVIARIQNHRKDVLYLSKSAGMVMYDRCKTHTYMVALCH